MTATCPACGVPQVDGLRDNNAPDNLVPSCQLCNFARSSRWNKAAR